jgi:hypothetical protein
MNDEQLELLAETMLDWSETSGDHHMLAAAAIRELIKLRREREAERQSKKAISEANDRMVWGD